MSLIEAVQTLNPKPQTLNPGVFIVRSPRFAALSPGLTCESHVGSWVPFLSLLVLPKH